MHQEKIFKTISAVILTILLSTLYPTSTEAKEALEEELGQSYGEVPDQYNEDALDQYQYYEEEPYYEEESSSATSNVQPPPIKYFDASNYQMVQSPEQSLALDKRLAEIAKKRLVNQVLSEPKMGDGTIIQQLARLYESNNKRAQKFMDKNFIN